MNFVLLMLILDPSLLLRPPAIGSGLAADNSFFLSNNLASVKGRLVKADGSPVLGAVVMVDNYSGQNDNIFYGSHSSINRDGSFEIAGIPSGATNYCIAVEPLALDPYGSEYAITEELYYNFTRGFSSGWLDSGNTLTAERTSALQFLLSAGDIKDLGVIVVP
jgi:hypothetical protein